MLGRIMLALLVVPILELWVMSLVAGQIGWPITLALIFVDSILGALLVRRQGVGAWNRIQQAIQQAKSPTRELVDGGLVVFGATLLLTPGFLTDALGYSMLIPATRAPVRNAIMRRGAVKAKTMTTQYTTARAGQFFTVTNMGPRGPVVDTDAREASATGPGAREASATGPDAREASASGPGAREASASGPGAREASASGPGAREASATNTDARDNTVTVHRVDQARSALDSPDRA